jgi:hypothetical protein
MLAAITGIGQTTKLGIDAILGRKPGVEAPSPFPKCVGCMVCTFISGPESILFPIIIIDLLGIGKQASGICCELMWKVTARIGTTSRVGIRV